MKTHSILEGKNKFSQVAASAAKGEPQIITKNGKETAVIVSYEEYRRLCADSRPLVEFMLDNPIRKYGLKIDLTRNKDTGRKLDLFEEDE